MVLSVKVNPKQIEGAINKAMARGIKGGLLRAGLRVEKEARNRAPVDTGSLRSSITSQWKPDRRFLGDGFVQIGPNVKSPEGAPYDVYQEFGTGIHGPRRQRIKPRRAKLLKFRTKDGNFISTKSVAGVPAVEYMQKGLEATPIDTEFTRGFNAVNR